MEPPTETKIAPIGGVTPLDGCPELEFADAVGDGTELPVEVEVPVVPVDEKLYEGAKLYADISIQDVVPRKVSRSYAATWESVRFVANDARAVDIVQADGPVLLYSPKITLLVWGLLACQTDHPAALIF